MYSIDLFLDPYKRRVNVFEKTSKMGRQESQLKMHQFILNQVLKDPDVLKYTLYFNYPVFTRY